MKTLFAILVALCIFTSTASAQCINGVCYQSNCVNGVCYSNTTYTQPNIAATTGYYITVKHCSNGRCYYTREFVKSVVSNSVVPNSTIVSRNTNTVSTAPIVTTSIVNSTPKGNRKEDLVLLNL